MEYRNAEFKCYNNLKSFLLSQWSAATAVTPTVTALFYARGCAAPLQELHPSLHWKGLSFIARQSSRRHRNKLENVQHKKSVTDGRGGHVLESQVRGLRDGHRQRACLQREAVRRALPSRQDAVGHSQKMRNHDGKYVPFITSQETCF